MKDYGNMTMKELIEDVIEQAKEYLEEISESYK